MREFLEDADKHRDDGYSRAQSHVRQPLPKRFYKDAGIRAVDNGFAVTLDGRLTRTPGQTPVVVPVEPLAGARSSPLSMAELTRRTVGMVSGSMSSAWANWTGCRLARCGADGRSEVEVCLKQLPRRCAREWLKRTPITAEILLTAPGYFNCSATL